MAIQTINLGTYANDGTGDDLRTAFEKVKANFIELYSTVFGANVGSVPPISGVEEGELWWSTVEGKLYIYYGTAWIEATPVPPPMLYAISATTATGGANIQLSDTNGEIDNVKIASSTNITVTRTDANTITLSSTSYTGNVTGDVTGNLTGNVTGSVSGNAGSVTNGVYTNGSYLDPTWITSIAGSKVSGGISGNAGSVTNGVYTTSSINVLADVDTVSLAPTIGQALIWNGTNWIPGSVVSGTSNNNFEFGTFTKIFTDPISYLLDKTGLDLGTFTSPAEQSVDLGTF
jgi:hypothetical protein